MGQSDTRKFAILYTQQHSTEGHGIYGGLTDTPAFDHEWTGLANDVVLEAFQKMGVPYDVILVPDSASWGATTPNESDAQWFADNYAGIICYVGRMNVGWNRELVEYFQDGNSVGTVDESPLAGDWETPTLVFMSRCTQGESWEMGFTNYSDNTGAAQGMIGFTNGDTLELEMTRQGWLDTTDTATMDSTTILLWADILSTETQWQAGVSPSSAVATKYRNTYNYLIGQEDMVQKPVPVLLGLAKLFEVADYTPRRKLGLMITLDHPVPDIGVFPPSVVTSRKVQYDSLMAHADQEGWQFNAQTTSWSGDTEGQLDGGWATTIGQDVKARGKQFHHVFHDHNVQMNWGRVGVTPPTMDIWGGDSTIIRQRWNVLTNRMVDSLGIKLATGYEKLWGAPTGNTNRFYLPIVAQSGHYGFRASRADPDSVGYWSLPKYTVGTWDLPQPPVLWADPKSDETMWAHAIYEWPSSTDTSWADAGGSGPTFSNSTPTGYNALVMRNAAWAAIWDGTLMWHLHANMLGPDPITTQMIRRIRYLTERCSNILEVRPTISPKQPRRHNASS
jgi:hypothetical protein